jgi:hypothetical protein
VRRVKTHAPTIPVAGIRNRMLAPWKKATRECLQLHKVAIEVPPVSGQIVEFL